MPRHLRERYVPINLKYVKSNYLVGTSYYKNKVVSLYCSRAVPPEIIWLPVNKRSWTKTLWMQAMVTQVALEALYYHTFALSSIDIHSPSVLEMWRVLRRSTAAHNTCITRHTWLLATWQLRSLRTLFLLEEKYRIFYYFWIAVYYNLRLHKRL